MWVIIFSGIFVPNQKISTVWPDFRFLQDFDDFRSAEVADFWFCRKLPIPRDLHSTRYLVWEAAAATFEIFKKQRTKRIQNIWELGHHYRGSRRFLSFISADSVEFCRNLQDSTGFCRMPKSPKITISARIKVLVSLTALLIYFAGVFFKIGILKPFGQPPVFCRSTHGLAGR